MIFIVAMPPSIAGFATTIARVSITACSAVATPEVAAVVVVIAGVAVVAYALGRNSNRASHQEHDGNEQVAKREANILHSNDQSTSGPTEREISQERMPDHRDYVLALEKENNELHEKVAALTLEKERMGDRLDRLERMMDRLMSPDDDTEDDTDDDTDDDNKDDANNDH